MPQWIEAVCGMCGKTFLAFKSPSKMVKHCSKTCREKVRVIAMKAMSDATRDQRIQRMTSNNPMADAACRQRVSTTMRERGYKPRVRGGNGAGPTEQEVAVATALSWPTNVVVVTGLSYRPWHYKVDVGNPDLKIAIEIDGRCHNSSKRREADRRKDTFLRSIGWSVLRFTNKDVDQNLTGCVQMVLSTISLSTATTISSPMAT